ncbi:MAG TPA: AAA family ATPase [Ktedonobacteraceae bacterium]|nr:AAA family ATPase [Ktedonobacteraceae bacterium]
MQIDAIYLDHFLSFDTFVWEGLDPHLNAIVGPNGVGKTNLFRALRAMYDALSPAAAQESARWAAAGHQGANANAITIALDIQFTTAWEQRLLCVFFASVLCDQQEIQKVGTVMQRSVDHDGLKRFDAWVLDQVRPEDIAWFLRGRLVMTHAGRSGWQCRYEARLGEPGFRLDLTNWGTLLGHAEYHQETATQNWGALFGAWYNSLTEQERDQLHNGLTGVTPEGEFPVPNFSRLPDWVSSQQGIALQIVDQMQIVDPTMLATRLAFTSAAQLSSPEPSRPIAVRFIFQRLLEQALVFTDNVRLPYQREYTARDLHTQPLDLSNGKELARFLFCKKNGGPRDRKQYAAIAQMFSRMTGRRFDVVQHPAEISGSQQEPQPDTSLELVTINPWGDISLEFSGAGIAEALFLSAVLAGSSGQVVLLDEPALNLHPTMQATLLDALQALAHQPEGERSQFLVNTHTPTLVPPDAIEHVSRLTIQNGHTIRQALKISQISQNDLVKLRNLLRGNLAARALLFSRAVLLVEGETELGALSAWYPDLMNRDIALYAVGGKGEFVSPLKLIQHFAIPWAILGDGEVLWDLHEQKSLQGAQGQVSRILAVCNQSLPAVPGDPGNSVENFEQWRQALETCGIFTLASSADEGFEKAVQTEIPSELWTDAKTKFDKNKVALGRFIAENSSCPGKVAERVRRVLCHLHKQDTGIRIPDDNCPQPSAARSGNGY